MINFKNTEHTKHASFASNASWEGRRHAMWYVCTASGVPPLGDDEDPPHELHTVSNADQVDPGARWWHGVDPILPQLPARAIDNTLSRRWRLQL